MTTKETHYWDGIAAAWLRERPHQLWRRHSDAVHAALLDRWLGRSRFGRVLKTDLFDECAGPGLVPYLAERAADVWGVDVSARVVVAAARLHPGLRASVGDVRRLPFASGSFDAIVSNSTLDHFDSPAEIHAAVAELARVLRPGGLLVLTLDNPVNPAVGLRNALPLRWLNRLGIVPYQVGATLGPRALRRSLEHAALEVRETTAILHCPRAPAVALCGSADRSAQQSSQERLLRWLGAFERLERWPTRYLTGYFAAALAMRPSR